MARVKVRQRGLWVPLPVVAGEGSIGQGYMYGKERNYNPGPVTHYALASKTDAGAGTEGNPLSASQAENLSVSGSKIHVEWLDGVGTRTATSERWVPLFYPRNSGTSDYRIVHRARNPGMVEFRHTSSVSSPPYGVGCPTFGHHERDYCIIDGFKADGAESQYHSDTGYAVIHDADYCEIHRADIQGVTLNMDGSNQDNHNGIRLERTIGSVCRNNRIRGMRANVYQGHNHAAYMFYGAEDFLCENDDIDDCNAAYFVKGTAGTPAVFNSGIIRWNRIWNVRYGFDMQDTIDGLDVIQNLLYDYAAIGFRFNSSGGDPAETTGIRLLLNTFGRTTMANASDSAIGHLVAAMTGTNCDISGNIFVLPGHASSLYLLAQSQIVATMNRNLYFNGASGNRWVYNSSSYSSLAAWQAAISKEANSAVGDPLFTDADADDFTLGGSSPALTMWSNGGPIGCFGSQGASQYIGRETPWI